MELSAEQKKVINLKSGWHACLAPAGSGKTEILGRRTIQAISAHGVDPKEMICLTFTNRAARDMRKRISKLSEGNCPDIFIGNTHAFALRMLQANNLLPALSSLADDQISKLIWSQVKEKLKACVGDIETITSQFSATLDKVAVLGFSIDRLESSDLIEIHYRLSAEDRYARWNLFGLCSVIRPLFSAFSDTLTDDDISHIKDRVIVFDKNIQGRNIPLALGLALTAFNIYSQIMAELRLYDHDDLLLMLLTELRAKKSLEMSQYSWCQIDEVQDISPLQWMIIKDILSESAHVLLLGDMTQSIYRFLGASVQITSHNLGKSLYSLSENFRSPKNLVEMFDLYKSIHFGDITKTVADKPASKSALIYVEGYSEIDHDRKLIHHAKRLITENKNVAFLCPTNKLVREYSEKFNELEVRHFCIHDKDIFTTSLGLDFMAFLSVIYEPRNRTGWSRLLWRFGNIASLGQDERSGDKPLIASFKFTAQLCALGCDIPDLLEGRDVKDYLLRRFKAAVTGDVTFFDTETTGLNPEVDVIIQLAGARSTKGILNSDVDLYCSTDRPLGSSIDVHHITEEVLASKGRLLSEQLGKFMGFIRGSVLIAHNLPFDDAMMTVGIKSCAPELLSSYIETEKYCTLEVARRLYPDLPKHKLGFLLEKFGLEGTNSHNALDDVKAGTSLMAHLAGEAEKRLERIDAVIESFIDTLERFRQKILPLWSNISSIKNNCTSVDVEMLFDVYFDYVKENKIYDVSSGELAELKMKLCEHALGSFKSDTINNFLADCMPFYQTAKESDLITDNNLLVLSTIHRSKGLEFDYVILPQMVEGVLPSYAITKQLCDRSEAIRNEASHLLIEQKRLVYVAMTRAKVQLVIGAYKYKGRYQRETCEFIKPVLHLFTKYSAPTA